MGSKPARDDRATEKLKEFGSRIEKARLMAGIKSQEDMARKLGIDAPRYRRYEYGATWPQIDVIEQMCAIFDVSADWLLFGRDHKAGRPKRIT